MKKTDSVGNAADVSTEVVTVETGTGKPGTPGKRRGKGELPQSAVVKDGKRLEVTDLVTAKEYMTLFNGLPLQSRAGYDNYWSKHDGFSNPESPAKLTPQGIAKMMLVLSFHAHRIIGEGGERADAMKKILATIKRYDKIAGEEVQTAKENEAMAQALRVVGPERLEAYLKQQGNVADTTDEPADADAEDDAPAESTADVVTDDAAAAADVVVES